MRRLAALVTLAALMAAPAALAKERNLSMVGAPVTPKAGHALLLRLKATIDGKPADGMGPMLRIVSPAGKTISIPSRATPSAGIYSARVVFPTAGLWRVLAVDRYSGRSYEFAKVRVRAA